MLVSPSPLRFAVSRTLPNPPHHGRRSQSPSIAPVLRRERPRKLHAASAALITDPDYFEVGGFVGSYGFMNITSYSSFRSEGFLNSGALQELVPGYSSEEIERLRVQDVGEGQVKISFVAGFTREE